MNDKRDTKCKHMAEYNRYGHEKVTLIAELSHKIKVSNSELFRSYLLDEAVALKSIVKECLQGLELKYERCSQ